mmetsp:Transcript_27051/g.87378  ORF Transcript_27051/g.87378 Transcript_27051/m.87378 type:complete len:245 (+) Transcript_27051:3819-4553(+)
MPCSRSPSCPASSPGTASAGTPRGASIRAPAASRGTNGEWVRVNSAVSPAASVPRSGEMVNGKVSGLALQSGGGSALVERGGGTAVRERESGSIASGSTCRCHSNSNGRGVVLSRASTTDTCACTDTCPKSTVSCIARPSVVKRGGRLSTASIRTEATHPAPLTLKCLTTQLSHTSASGWETGPSRSGAKATEKRPAAPGASSRNVGVIWNTVGAPGPGRAAAATPSTGDGFRMPLAHACWSSR